MRIIYNKCIHIYIYTHICVIFMWFQAALYMCFVTCVDTLFEHVLHIVYTVLKILPGSFPLSVRCVWPDNQSEITNNDLTCGTCIEHVMNPRLYQIKYAEKYMPELFLTPRVPNTRNYQFLMILLRFSLTLSQTRFKNIQWLLIYAVFLNMFNLISLLVLNIWQSLTNDLENFL